MKNLSIHEFDWARPSCALVDLNFVSPSDAERRLGRDSTPNVHLARTNPGACLSPAHSEDGSKDPIEWAGRGGRYARSWLAQFFRPLASSIYRGV
ncbi:MAG: hypothetical protein ABSC94_08550 [Polyangiaceae bacterium]